MGPLPVERIGEEVSFPGKFDLVDPKGAALRANDAMDPADMQRWRNSCNGGRSEVNIGNASVQCGPDGQVNQRGSVGTKGGSRWVK